jgi:hypothetical protein
VPIQRYIRVTGSIGRPPVQGFKITYNAELFQKPGQRGMPGPATQFNIVEPTKRLFFMRSHMFGIPIAVLHDYEGNTARMKVRVASLVNVVNVCNDDLTRTETVTFLNDLCFFAPSRLVDPRLQWSPIDNQHTEVRFTNGHYRVSAVLEFNDAAH